MSQDMDDVVKTAATAIANDLRIGISLEKVTSYYSDWMSRKLKQNADVSTKSDAPKVVSAKKVVTVASALVKPKKATRQLTRKLLKSESDQTLSTSQLVKGLLKLSEKYSYYSLGQVLGLSKNAAYFTLRAWCTGEYAPNETNQSKIRKLLLDVQKGNVKVLSRLNPVGKRPKGGIRATSRNK